MSHLVRRYAFRGALIGLALAALWLGLQLRAEARGVRAIGIAELALLTSLPGSLLTWGALLVAPSTAAGEIPRWASYAFLGLSPVLNWAALGALLGAFRGRRASCSCSTGTTSAAWRSGPGRRRVC